MMIRGRKLEELKKPELMRLRITGISGEFTGMEAEIHR
jgi:hypothetical protein